jgi:hypothetical protein
MKEGEAMGFMTTKEAADKWEISDRRVRTLCSEGKVPGTVKDGRSYKIPIRTKKPTDGRIKSIKEGESYFKWNNEIIGVISQDNTVKFTMPDFNEVVFLYTKGEKNWTSEQFTEFLSERVVSRDRRDIEKILFRCGLSHYDVLKITEITRIIHPKDLLWISNSINEKLDEVMTEVFSSVFHQKIDLFGDSIDTPEGYNIKRYGVYNGKYGIYKQRISPLHTDVESEVAVHLLAQKLGIPCCPAYKVDRDTVFSEFLYDFSREYIVHFRRLFDGRRSINEYQNLTSIRPKYKNDIAKMVLLDFITRQDDRHLSNIAIKISGGKETFYPLYDNGRSLFYEDTEELVNSAVEDIQSYATSFGFSGTYYDYVLEINKERGSLKNLINTNISEKEISDILVKADFSGYRLMGATKWIMKAIEFISKL